MATDRIPEIREADASPEVAEIYRQIKVATGVPQVNLIWRHFASQPAMLSFAWHVLAPVLKSARLHADADALLMIAGGSGSDARVAPIWEAIVQPEQSGAIRNVLTFYNRGNTTNLIALTALALYVRSRRAESTTMPAAPATTAPRAPLAHIPPLPVPDTLAPETLAMVDRMASRHPGSAIGVTPSLYLHLALWPEALGAAEERLAPVVGSEGFGAIVSALMSEAEARARALTTIMPPHADRPPAEILKPMCETLDRFLVGTIPEMIVVGAHLAGTDTRA